MSIARIKEAVDLRELAREYGEFRSMGEDLVGSCLFHSERTGSLRIHREFYRCFGCGAGGDCFTFLAAIEDISVGAAMRQLSDRTGIALADYKPQTKTQRVLASEDAAFCEWWRKRHVEEWEPLLTALVYLADRRAVEVGQAIKGLREMSTMELRQYVAKTVPLGDRAVWRADKADATEWAEFIVDVCALSVELETRPDLLGSARYDIG